MIDQLQNVIDKLSIIMCGYGTGSIEDVFFISFGTDLEIGRAETCLWSSKKELIFAHVKPIGYKTFHWKQSRTKPRHTSELGHSITVADPICINKIVEDVPQIESSNQYECFDIDYSGKPNYVRIHGVRVVVHNEKTQKTLIIQGIVDEVPLECIKNEYIQLRKREIMTNLPESDTFQPLIMKRIVETMTIKDALIYGNDDYYKRHISILTDVNFVKYNKLNVSMRRFLDMDAHNQRSMLINLLIYNQEDEVQYITYLLYDLISAKSASSTVDSADQQIMYDSFPWRIKLFFKDTMKNTIKFTKDMISKYDVSRISLEQQIYVMKVPDNVREKAMSKLKEIKGKADDTGAKAKQYLEGLLKIPFGVHREEPILKKPKQTNKTFVETADRILNLFSLKSSEDALIRQIVKKDGALKSHYSATEIVQFCDNFEKWIRTEYADTLRNSISSTKQINSIFSMVIEHMKMNVKKTAYSKSEKKDCIVANLPNFSEDYLLKIRDELVADGTASSQRVIQDLRSAKSASLELKHDLSTITAILDESIHGHDYAKNQILKIIGQWMNGEQSGYCFGFEGSPGVGKTSLAKRGLANCLKNENGDPRPFAFIALGGSCNGSTLEGHSYTYVNSTWGRIVDVLMDSKCMNPIIYIDELDKVSKTEHGKEIIGILMHLIDTTQNSGFQDKYFSGIDIDLSKALFIFSYNDASQIDRILLDRIHRIKFDNLSLQEKMVITRKYVLPEIIQKMGLESCIDLSDDLIEYIVESYTLESGVRKLKEVIFDLYGEINIELLKCENVAVSLPIVITKEMLGQRYLTKYDKITEKKIHRNPAIGVINGLWANGLGAGGIIPIQVAFYPTNTFLELRLTGMQGDVMKESMNVAKSLAWSLLSDETRAKCLERFEKTKEQGLHIHCPDGATPKDGPSAGAAITAAIYSLFSERPIKNDVAMTGEINLQGEITEIGGLEQKIFGGTKAGINTFLYPVSNQRDFDKLKTKPYVVKPEFHAVSHISEVFEKIFAQHT
jgi:ATP-dependent Lon protease